MADPRQGAAPISPARRRLRIFTLIVVAGIVLWQIFVTETKVADLRARGFTDVAIDSTRDHAYLPLIGGVLGAALSIGAIMLLKRLLRRKPRSA